MKTKKLMRVAVPKNLLHEVTFRREALLASWGRVDACVGDEGVVRIDLRPGAAEVSGRDLVWQVSGQEEIACKGDPVQEDLAIGFMSRLFGLFLDKMPWYEVKMRIRDGGFAVLFSEDDDDDGRKIEPKTEMTVMLMPVMLD